MRILLYLPVLLVAAWVGYWVIAAQVLERSIGGWLDARATEGWVANYDEVRVGGFPGRFSTSVTQLELADPETGIAWSAPEFRFDAASIRPHRITAVWPETQVLASPFERITIAAETMQGRIEFEPNTALALRSTDINLSDIALTSTLGWEAALSLGSLITEQSDFGPNAHKIAFRANDLVLSDPARRQLDPASVLPREIGLMKLDATVDFDAPWDRFAIETARPQITAIDLEGLQATWGELDLRAAGAVTVDAEGIPTGEVTVKATNWREMLGVAEASGVLPAALAPTVERALEIVASLSGPEDTIDLPLTFRNGRTNFGPIPLGPAPRLILR